jgi:hypothetical protein
MAGFLRSGTSLAGQSGEHKGSHRDRLAEQAAEELALACGILARAILEGIVRWLENRSGTRRRGSIASLQAVGTTETAIPTDEDVAQLVAHLHSCKLDSSFAVWVEQNWKDLFRNSRLRSKRFISGGSITARSARVSSGRTPSVPLAPVSDPPTFSPDVSLVAQAAALVAASAQGTPFCPV